MVAGRKGITRKSLSHQLSSQRVLRVHREERIFHAQGFYPRAQIKEKEMNFSAILAVLSVLALLIVGCLKAVNSVGVSTPTQQHQRHESSSGFLISPTLGPRVGPNNPMGIDWMGQPGLRLGNSGWQLGF